MSLRGPVAFGICTAFLMCFASCGGGTAPADNFVPNTSDLPLLDSQSTSDLNLNDIAPSDLPTDLPSDLPTNDSEGTPDTGDRDADAENTPDDAALVETCVAECGDNECGGDGCAGECGTCVPGSHCESNRCVFPMTLCEQVVAYSQWPQDLLCIMCSTGFWDSFTPDIDSECLLSCLAGKSAASVCGTTGFPELCPHCVKTCGPYPCGCIPNFTVSAGATLECSEFDHTTACQTICAYQSGDICEDSGTAEVAVCPGRAVVSTTLLVSGRGFSASEVVRINVEAGSRGSSISGPTATAAASGTFKVNLPIGPEIVPGLYRLRGEYGTNAKATDWHYFRIDKPN